MLLSLPAPALLAGGAVNVVVVAAVSGSLGSVAACDGQPQDKSTSSRTDSQTLSTHGSSGVLLGRLVLRPDRLRRLQELPPP
eukprot:2659171-Alexandrium_andersonii.AAC.1